MAREFSQSTTNKDGRVKVVHADTIAALATAVSLAQNDQIKVGPNINLKADANKFYTDF